MTSVAPVARDRDARLLAAQLDVLADVVAGVPLSSALMSLLEVVESVAADGMLASVLLVDPSGARLRHAAAPSLPTAYNESIDGLAIGPRAGSCGTAAYRCAQVIVEDIASDPLWEDFRDLALPSGLRACWSTPILDREGRLLGTFALYYPSPRRPSPADLALISVLVRTVSMAVERSRADARREQELAAERSVALTLQHSLLPEVPARVGPVRLAARYRTGDPGVEVGGDWFDAFAVDEGVVIVVGDVQGHDLDAAALMGQLRTVVRAFAAEGHPPASVLVRADDYLSRLGTERLATVLVVHLDERARVATVASAGHPPPVLLTPVGDRHRASALDLSVGPPLGLGLAWPERSTVLPADSVLLLYTDGLVETRSWSIDEGIRRLHAVLEQLPAQADLDRVLDAALGVVPSGQRGDDVALLAAATRTTGDGALRKVHRWFPPQPLSAPLARSWAEGLLRAWDVRPAEVEDASLVLSELVTNAARHSEESIRVQVGLDGTDVRIEVFDRSHRLPLHHALEPEGTAGRGLHIVEALAAEWGVDESLEGKTVWATLVERSR